MSENPYEAPSEIEYDSFMHRCCPQCGQHVRIGKVLTTTAFARWPCERCGCVLRINKTRRLIAASCIGGILVCSIGVGMLLWRFTTVGSSLAGAMMFALVTLPLPLVIDGVKRAG